MQLYKVIDYEAGHYIVDYYKNVYDLSPVQLQISRWKFDKWVEGKLDKSELEGNKVKLWEIRNKKSNTIKKPTYTLSDKEKDIMDIVKDIVSNTYAIEKEVCNSIKGYSKALIGRTMRNKDILDLYELERVRANKEIKEEMGIDIKGYPYILCRK